MKKVPLISIMCMLVLIVGCRGSGSAPDNGSLTVTVTVPAGTFDNQDSIAEVFAKGEGPDDPLALNLVTVFGSSAVVELELPATFHNGPSGITWIGTGGMTYDVYVFVDADGSYTPTTGDQVYNNLNPVRYVQDGDKTIETGLSGYSNYDPPGFP